MLPKFNKERPLETHQSVQETTAANRRNEEAREDSLNDNDEEKDDSSQFDRRTMGRIQERPMQGNPYSITKTDLTAEQTCQLSSSNGKISFMDQIRKTFGCLPSIFSSSKKQNVSSHPQQGNFSGVPLAPVLKAEQVAYLKSKIRSNAPEFEELEKSSKVVAFHLEESEEKDVDANEVTTVQELSRQIFPGEAEVQQYSAAFVQLQQRLNKRIKAISVNAPEKVELQMQLQTELNNLRAERDLATLARRTEIKQELKRLKAMSNVDPVKLVQIAQLYAETYPEAREAVQQMLNWIQENPERQHELAVAVLSDATIKLLEIASRTVAPHEIEPIKRRDDWIHRSEKPFDIPYEIIASKVYEKYNLPSKDLNDALAIRAANNAFQNLQASQKILKKILKQQAPEEIGKDLHEAQVQKADRDDKLSCKEEEYIQAKLTPWVTLFLPQERDENYQTCMAPLMEEVKVARSKTQSLIEVTIEKAKSEPLVVFSDIKKSAVIDTLSLIQSGLDAADDFREMLLKRSEKK